jgi:uncharacterized Zn-binding protein involved in type VI secretion
MSPRYPICHGDSTTRDGMVLAFRANTINGRAVACEGDEVICRQCGKTGSIACTGARTSNTIDGRQIALTWDICLCDCNPAPCLIHSQTLRTCA